MWRCSFARRIEHPDVVGGRHRVPDATLPIEAQRVGIDAVGHVVDRELFRLHVEARELVARGERDPDRAVGRGLERVRTHEGVRGRGRSIPTRKHPARQQVAMRNLPGLPLASRDADVESVKEVLGTIDRVDAAIGMNHEIVLGRRAAPQLPLLDHGPAHLGLGRRQRPILAVVREQLREGVLGIVGLDEDVGQLVPQALADHRSAPAHQQDQLLPLVMGARPMGRPIPLLVAERALLPQLVALLLVLDALEHEAIPVIGGKLLDQLGGVGHAQHREVDRAAGARAEIRHPHVAPAHAPGSHRVAVSEVELGREIVALLIAEDGDAVCRIAVHESHHHTRDGLTVGSHASVEDVRTRRLGGRERDRNEEDG